MAKKNRPDYKRLKKISLGWSCSNADLASFLGKNPQNISYWKNHRPEHYEALALGYWAHIKQIKIKDRKVPAHDLANFFKVTIQTISVIKNKKPQIYELLKKGFLIIENYETHKMYSKIN